MRWFSFLLTTMLWAILAGSALAAAAGTAVGVNPQASDVAKTTRTLVVGADVAMGDRVVTGPTGQVQIIFTDQTHLVVGPSSSLIIASYLMRNGGSASRFAIQALGGTFRFITGESDHSAYTISTPTGTIGVRGTAFDFIVDPRHPIVSGRAPGTAVALYRGAVWLCDLGGKCVELTEPCDLGAASRGDAFTVDQSQAAAGGVRDRFRYIANQRSLLGTFRIPEAGRCFISLAVPKSLAPAMSGGTGCVPSKRGGQYAQSRSC
jgi:FecR protein